MSAGTKTFTLNTTRFGEITYEEEDIITFVEPLLGLNECQRFLILNARPDTPFRWLHGIDEPAIALLITATNEVVPQYKPKVSPFSLERIGASSADGILLYATVSIPPGCPQDMTLNLMGPILINASNRQALQVVLDDESYTTKYRVFPKETAVNVQAA